jgi:hypothetical protein
MKIGTVSAIAALAFALGSGAAFAQSTGSSTNNSMASPPPGYNNSTVGPASSNKSQSSQYTQGNSQSLTPSSAQGQAEQSGSTPTKTQ